MNHNYFFYYIPYYIFQVIFEQFKFFFVIQVLIFSVLKLSFIFSERFLELRYQSVLINLVVEFSFHHTGTALGFEPNLGWHYADQRRLLVGKDFEILST